MSHNQRFILATLLSFMGLFSAIKPVYGIENLDSLDEVASLFYSNEIAAFDRYNGAHLQVNGNVEYIDSQKDLLILASGNHRLSCFYAKRDHSNLVLLRIGGKVSVQGGLNIQVSDFKDPIFTIEKCRILGPYSGDIKDLSPKKLDSDQLEDLRFKKILENLN